ncbi:hypothetical protein [Actinokineospora globicatena]|uniref:LPXTG-motif cell wall anchor domain-containing protein n=1 Tax=Actinokineospora globicatena TaxID=103729 RepID=A0A9W6VBT2_9PSEU|nr:hypothetical protein [Actinokineospora globicatena]GLW93273.1 hypothetical protein Aglo03_40890 [Actinokineospora globicatena]
MPRPTRFRLSTVAFVVAALALSAPQAHADPVRRAEVVPLPRTALDAAVAAATTPQAISFARTNFKQGGHPEPATITVAGSGLPVYALAPDFVRGDPAAAPGRFAYVAVVATADDGRQATMAAAPDPDGTWHITGVLSGADEHHLAPNLPTNGVLLNEPQINGWYALTPTAVTLLQASLPQTPLNTPIPLTDYQHQVNTRYADKLPGSTYQNNSGLGFKVTTPAPAAQPPPTPNRTLWWLTLTAIAAVALTTATLAWRRTHSQRRHTP